MPKIAKLFNVGTGQAVQLPAEFRFDVDQVYVRRDTTTGDVILSTHPQRSWAEFMRVRAALGPAPADFLAEREQGSERRDPLDWWTT